MQQQEEEKIELEEKQGPPQEPAEKPQRQQPSTWQCLKGFLRKLKTIVFCVMGIYTSAVLFLAFVEAFDEHPVYSRDKPTDRCIKLIDNSDALKEMYPEQVTVSYSIAGGRRRIGLCTSISEEEADAVLGDKRFDPLDDATESDCYLDDSASLWAAEKGCEINEDAFSDEESYLDCSTVFSPLVSVPYPWGIAWLFRIDSTSNDSATECAAVYSMNDVDPCEHPYVYFYKDDSGWLIFLYACTAVYGVVLWFWEVACIRKFTNFFGPNFGDLSFITTPMEGTVGAIYLGWRVIKSQPPLKEYPHATFAQMGRNLILSVLSVIISITAIAGCSFSFGRWEMLLLLAFHLPKALYVSIDFVCGLTCGKPKLDAPELGELGNEDAIPEDVLPADQGMNMFAAQYLAVPVPQRKDVLKGQKQVIQRTSPRLAEYYLMTCELLFDPGCCEDALPTTEKLQLEVERLTELLSRPHLEPTCEPKIKQWLLIIGQFQASAKPQVITQVPAPGQTKEAWT